MKATLSFVFCPSVQYLGMKDQIFDLIDQSKLLPSQIAVFFYGRFLFFFSLRFSFFLAVLASLTSRLLA